MLSLCIPTMNRFDQFLSKNLEKYLEYLDKGLIAEIVISDETGEDYAKLQEKYATRLGENFRIFKDDSVLGVFKNKLHVCRLAKYEHVVLIDSDNFSDRNYFLAATLALQNCRTEKYLILAPSFARPHKPLNYKQYCGVVTRHEVASLSQEERFLILLNTGNFVLSKAVVDEFVYDGDDALISMISSCDVIYFNLLAFQQFPELKMHIVKDMEYDHAVHSGSLYLRCHHAGDKYYHNTIIPALRKLSNTSVPLSPQ